jgi:hypothetical protein
MCIAGSFSSQMLLFEVFRSRPNMQGVASHELLG